MFVDMREDFSDLLIRPVFAGELKAFRWYLFKGRVTKSLLRGKRWSAVERLLFGLGESLRGGQW